MMTQERLKTLLRYYPKSGRFVWRVTRRGVYAGMEAGSLDGQGYVVICINGHKYRAHRLAHFYMKGEWPKRMDHRDLDRANNRWLNLREATASENASNRSYSNQLGFRGVTKNGKRFAARIHLHGNCIRLGTYDTPQEAHAVYAKAAAELHGEFARAA